MKKVYYDRNNRSFARVVPMFTDDIKVRAVNKHKKFIEIEDTSKELQFKGRFVKSDVLQVDSARDYIISSRYNPTPFLIFTGIYMIALIATVVIFETQIALSVLLVLLAINLAFSNDFRLMKNKVEIRPITKRERSRIESEK